MIQLSSLVPDAAHLLELDIEELAGILLIHLNSCKQGDCTAVQHGQVSQDNFFRDDRRGKPPEYGARQQEVDLALAEAWAWLQSECLLVRKPGGDNWLVFSRRGKQITSRDDVASYLKAQLLPKRQIHPLIASKVYPAFLRGEYDTAIFQAFREVEVAVRQAGQFPQTLVGDKLMRAAFATGKSNGPLTDTQLPPGEQEAMGHLFAGAFGLYRNSTAHRYVPTDPEQAAEVIIFASQLLRIVDHLKP
jgi:uncharacterized protein (TIGR02391 family)